MRRREFLGVLGGGAAAIWPLVAQAQRASMPVIGFLSGQAADTYSRLADAMRKGLNETGYVEGRNVSIEYRWADGHDDRLPKLAADLVGRQVAVIVCGGSPAATIAAKAATGTIPIIFTTGSDPLKLGYVTSYNRPDGNVTGVAFLVTQLTAKRLSLLHDLIPQATTIAGLFNPKNPDVVSKRKVLEEASRSVGLRLYILSASTESEIDSAFASLAERKAGALFVDSDAFFLSNRDKLTALAAHYAVPATYELREYAAAGGLMSYGTSVTEAYHQAGIYTGRILSGEKPGDLPVMQSAKFELVLNLKTAKALGLGIPPTLLATADEVIE